MDHLFSSPEKVSKNKKANGMAKNLNATISSEEDMDVDDSKYKIRSLLGS
jgi:hypothetical protein